MSLLLTITCGNDTWFNYETSMSEPLLLLDNLRSLKLISYQGGWGGGGWSSFKCGKTGKALTQGKHAVDSGAATAQLWGGGGGGKGDGTY